MPRCFDPHLEFLPAAQKEADQELLRAARDQIDEVPDVRVTPGDLAVPLGECDPA